MKISKARLRMIIREALDPKDKAGLEALAGDENAVARKKLFRKLSKKYHPDRNRDNPDATQDFQELSSLYDSLEDDGMPFVNRGDDSESDPFHDYYDPQTTPIHEMSEEEIMAEIMLPKSIDSYVNHYQEMAKKKLGEGTAEYKNALKAINEILADYDEDQMLDYIHYVKRVPKPVNEKFLKFNKLGFEKKEILYPFISILFLEEAYHKISLGDFSSFVDYYTVGANHSRMRLKDGKESLNKSFGALSKIIGKLGLISKFVKFFGFGSEPLTVKDVESVSSFGADLPISHALYVYLNNKGLIKPAPAED